MKYEKRFIDLGGTNAIIIPNQWIKSAEKEHDKKMLGVTLEVNSEIISVTPLWEEVR